jgi:hypothetical protein
LSISRSFELRRWEPEARVRVRCAWTAHPGEREAGKERVVFFFGCRGMIN